MLIYGTEGIGTDGLPSGAAVKTKTSPDQEEAFISKTLAGQAKATMNYEMEIYGLFVCLLSDSTPGSFCDIHLVRT